MLPTKPAGLCLPRNTRAIHEYTTWLGRGLIDAQPPHGCKLDECDWAQDLWDSIAPEDMPPPLRNEQTEA